MKFTMVPTAQAMKDAPIPWFKTSTLSRRDEFALRIAEDMLTIRRVWTRPDQNGDTLEMTGREIVLDAIKHADAMMAELDEGKQP